MTMEIAGKTIISIQNLEIGYRSGTITAPLVPPLAADVKCGELISVIGLNGIGKSTLLKTIAGLMPSLGGEILIKGRKISEHSRYEMARNIGYISTESVRVNSMRVLDLVRLGRYPHTDWTGRFDENDHGKVEEAIANAGITHLSERFINELSDGERQRAMIARTLAQDTDILIMDEPTAFLDVRSRHEVIHLLHDLSERRGKTIICSTHDLSTALDNSDRIWLLFSDSFEDGAPEDLILSGSFQSLFDNSSVRFDPSDASLKYSRPVSGSVNLKSESNLRYWTVRAITRAGFEIGPSGSDITIEAYMSGSKPAWRGIKNMKETEFASVYDLVRWLTSR
ncbi:MAG TPA: ABC transporter ATP-binding protein [Bacteroidales bacterium]|nr:ABC transporter ATP-binding protein [Bacteroidales bacterium]